MTVCTAYRLLPLMAIIALASPALHKAGLGQASPDRLLAEAGELEFAPDRRLVHWRNHQRQVDYELEPVRTYQSGGGEYCREYQGQVVSGSARQRIAGRACRQSDGSWRIQN